MENKQKKLFTLVFVFDDDKQRLLLGLKKRGFGLGKYNGFGGKVEANESIVDAAARELNEECGLSVRDSNALTFAGINYFDFIGHPVVFEVHVFKIRFSDVNGTVTESNEMRPQWYRYDEIPFDQMWPDDRYWFPSLFKTDVKFTGRYLFESIESDVLVEENLVEERNDTTVLKRKNTNVECISVKYNN
ncbi:7,8-dihydro-8-oxoguanine triphosphatase-like [Bradysia coprophila]|uniref:7,8-dihydro-8-oxoguanine triphosphatase-like n=1 Tax=Bradysia coprophila TaxID=38358 RepID=UPI00187D9A11|nr:7,8-dihydro-8-oxoguanine triphosphatase-like [Bradysia coprophila]